MNTLVSNHGVGTAGESGIALVGDGAGGTFLIWEDSGVGVIRTQRLDASGKPLWTSDVVSTSPAYQASPSAVSDGNGGVLVAWIDGRNGGCDSISQLNCALYAQHLDAQGARLWGDDGIPITARAAYPAANRFAMISDNDGGSYLAWSSGQDTYHCCSYYMQHITFDGVSLWAANGIRISELPTVITGPGVTGPRLVPDDSGGAILAWWNQQFADGSKMLLAQRVDASGRLLWSGIGVPLPFPAGGHSNFDAAADGLGGVIVAVQSSDVPNSSATHIYLQRASASGQALWGPGLQVSTQPGAQTSPVLVADKQGGAFLGWSLYDLANARSNRVAVAHIGSNGSPLWPAEVQVTATAVGQYAPRLANDGNGGVMVGWEDCRAAGTSDCATAYDIYAQHLDRDGHFVWNNEGVSVSAAKNNQGIDYGAEKRPGFEMIPSGTGGWTFAWPDGRAKPCSSSPAASCDLYAQHVSP